MKNVISLFKIVQKRSKSGICDSHRAKMGESFGGKRLTV